MKTALIYGGGTFSHVRAHLALCAPAFGKTAKQIHSIMSVKDEYVPFLKLTKMANPFSSMVTNEDVRKSLVQALEHEETKLIFFNAALCDFDGLITDELDKFELSGKLATRLKTADGGRVMNLYPAEKVLTVVKELRPDVTLVAFKTTCNQSVQTLAGASENLMKQCGADFVFGNDIGNYRNTILCKSGDFFTDLFHDREAMLLKLVSLATGEHK